MSLRMRVRLLVTLMAFASAFLIAIVLFSADRWVEDAAIRDLLKAEMGRMLSRGTPPDPRFDTGATMQFLGSFRTRAVPAEVAKLRPGVKQDLEVQGQSYWVLTRELAGGERGFIVYRADRIERREYRLWLATAACVLVLLVLALAYGGRLATYALKPFDRLVAQIRGLDPNRRGQRLSGASEDLELDTIRASLNAHLEKVDAIVEHERAFAAAASHELRSPLSVIQGSAELLGASASPAQRASVERLARAARQTNEIMEALLALSRRDEQPRVESLALVKWLPEAAEPFLNDAPGIVVHWKLEPVTLMAQAGAARVVFTNLLRNALQATGRGEVRISLDAQGVTIDDTGGGIPEEALTSIFTPGFRLHDGGSGMGLYIARAVADRNGWEVDVTNRTGGGARAQWRFAPAPASQ